MKIKNIKNIILCLIILILLIIILIILLPNRELFINNNNSNNYHNNNIKNNIDKIYVINLKKNKDRLKQFIEDSNKAFVKVDRFEAIYGKELPNDHPDIFKYFTKDNKLAPGQIGCALSHIKIWEDAIKNNYKNIIVFEDDALIPEDFWKKCDESFSALQENWDMLLLGCYPQCNLDKDNKVLGYGNDGTHAYILSNNLIKKILPNLKNIDIPIDTWLQKNIYKQHNIYGINIIKQNREFQSDICEHCPTYK